MTSAGGSSKSILASSRPEILKFGLYCKLRISFFKSAMRKNLLWFVISGKDIFSHARLCHRGKRVRKVPPQWEQKRTPDAHCAERFLGMGGSMRCPLGGEKEALKKKKAPSTAWVPRLSTGRGDRI